MTTRILLIKRAALGDILMATPLIRQLKQKINDIQLDCLVSSEFAVALKDNPYIDNLITLPGNMFSLKKMFSLIRFAWSLRGKYDYVFILDKHYYFNFIGRIISQKTIGYVREPVSRLFLHRWVRYYDVMRYHGLYYLDLLKVSGLALPDYTDYKLDLLINANDTAYAKDILHKYQLDKFIIIINSGGNNQFETGGVRMLPEDKVIQLIKHAAKITKVVLLGGLSDKINYNNYLKLVDNQNVISLAGMLSIKQSAALMTYADRIYTTDCGAMHIALSQGLFDQLYCFFGPTCPKHVLPPDMGIEYYWGDVDIFDKNYPLYGERPLKDKYFSNLELKNFEYE